ncbi:MAG: ABC transporter permease, partial [Phycisphaerae bacterium]|nr:ABC transporter permease [Phycisphaerae bacterium]
MSAPAVGYEPDASVPLGGPSESVWSRVMRSGRITVGGGILLLIVAACVLTMPWTLSESSPLFYGRQYEDAVRAAPGWSVDRPDGSSPARAESRTGGGSPPSEKGAEAVGGTGPARSWLVGLFGFDAIGRSILARCLLGGTISLAVGVAAALIAVVLGVTVGLVAGYSGGWIDSLLMRLVDILYGLPYILLVILFKIALEDPITRLFETVQTGWFSSSQAANLVVMFLAIGLVSWLTMARVVRGQVLAIRAMPFIEACRAMGLPRLRIFRQHVLPNLVGPITVYATLTVPSAILQESFLSFLGVGVRPPLPTWGSLASEGVLALSPVKVYWWMLLFPCLLLMLTLLCLNFVGDG